MAEKNIKKQAKKPIATQKWSMELITYSNGSTELIRINDGFEGHHLQSLLYNTTLEIHQQIYKNNYKPSVIKRKVIKD